MGIQLYNLYKNTLEITEFGSVKFSISGTHGNKAQLISFDIYLNL